MLLARIKPNRLFVAPVFLAACWAFIEIAEEVLEGEADAFDRWVMLWLQILQDTNASTGLDWLAAVARDITALGSPTVLGLVSLAVVLFLLLEKRWWSALFVTISSLSGTLLTLLLKSFVSRPRPTLFPHGDLVATSSFPSGHAMISAVVYLTLGAMLSRVAPSTFSKLYILGVALLLTIFIGVSRVYLGVHWPTDVLAGWIGGAAWALGWWGIAELLKRKKDKEI